MTERSYNVLFVCTGNSARSIMAESILNKGGTGRFHAFSAGSRPTSIVNPLALKVLKSFECPTEGLRSKSWDEFARAKAPVIDFVITLCDDAAGETCPEWPGQPIRAHWGIEDPAAVEGLDMLKEAAFVAAFHHLENRIAIFTEVMRKNLDNMTLGTKLREIGQIAGASARSRSAM
ncbi:MAG: arsenate reductase ArsC [Beijerinckiaceae bacterium]